MREIAKDTNSKILREQFIPDHVFIFLANGSIDFFDGDQSQTFKAGDSCIARKNRLIKFSTANSTVDFEPILFCFDEAFLQHFQQKYQSAIIEFKANDSLIKIKDNQMVQDFIHSLKPYYKGVMQLDEAFEDLKYEELLVILLRNQPELSGLLFNFDKPHKINLEEFMNRNYKFNVSTQRFAYLTGRSISAFKRDFQAIFNDTPGRWLIKKRLEEAYFLITKNNKKPSDIYLNLGFEDLSHFSFAFKKLFGFTPSEALSRALM